MRHPDFSITPVAGTAIYNVGRDWAPYTSGNDQTQRIAAFHECKLNASRDDFYRLLALELQRRMGPGDHTFKDVEKWWSRQDSHFVFEGHLPPVVSLTMVEQIIMPG